jgi:hypothetical protein
MKRSEMADIIAEYFRETDTSDITEEDGSRYHGRIILAILESEGMLPPLNNTPIHHYNLDAWQALTSTYNTWEDE